MFVLPPVSSLTYQALICWGGVVAGDFTDNAPSGSFAPPVSPHHTIPYSIIRYYTLPNLTIIIPYLTLPYHSNSMPCHTIPYHEVILHRQRVNWAQPASHLIITTVTPSSSSSSPTWRTFLNGPHVAQCCAHLGFSSMEFWILCFGSINFCLSPWSWSYISLSFSSLMKSVHAFPPPPPPPPQFNLTMHPPSGSFAAVSIAAKSPVRPLITKVTRLLPLNHDWDITPLPYLTLSHPA